MGLPYVSLRLNPLSVVFNRNTTEVMFCSFMEHCVWKHNMNRPVIGDSKSDRLAKVVSVMFLHCKWIIFLN